MYNHHHHHHLFELTHTRIHTNAHWNRTHRLHRTVYGIFHLVCHTFVNFTVAARQRFALLHHTWAHLHKLAKCRRVTRRLFARMILRSRTRSLWDDDDDSADVCYCVWWMKRGDKERQSVTVWVKQCVSRRFDICKYCVCITIRVQGGKKTRMEVVWVLWDSYCKDK